MKRKERRKEEEKKLLALKKQQEAQRIREMVWFKNINKKLNKTFSNISNL